MRPNPEGLPEYKLLFAKANIHDPIDKYGVDIIKKAYGRTPILVVLINLETNKVISTKNPPPYVVWGNIPTPLF